MAQSSTRARCAARALRYAQRLRYARADAELRAPGTRLARAWGALEAAVRELTSIEDER